MELLIELRSPDPARVSAALANASNLSRIHVAQIVDLLAWDEEVCMPRKITRTDAEETWCKKERARIDARRKELVALGALPK